MTEALDHIQVAVPVGRDGEARLLLRPARPLSIVGTKTPIKTLNKHSIVLQDARTAQRAQAAPQKVVGERELVAWPSEFTCSWRRGESRSTFSPCAWKPSVAKVSRARPT